MHSSLSRRGRIRAVSFFAAVLVLSIGTAVSQHVQRIQLQRAVTNSYLHAFSEVTASLDKMDAALQKGVYVTTSPMLCSLCSEVFAQAMTAQLALGQLPFANVELEQTAAFVSTVGDYAQALSRSAALDGNHLEQNMENWQQLSAAAKSLSAQLNELELELFDGTFAIDDVAQAEQRLSEPRAEGETTSLSGFQAIEADFPELPSLIYDGPFSQHLTGRTPAMLEGREEVSEQQALEIAHLLTGHSGLTLTGKVDGEIPAYTFTCGNPGETCTVEITRQGGELLSYFTEGLPAAQKLTPEQGIDAARQFLARLGQEDMGESYYTLQSNILTINFCYAPQGVRCYPDLVKVSVSLEDGSILGYEGRGYLVNHRARELAQPTVTREQAQEKVSSLLTVLSSNLAVIPTRGEYEVLCWEFLCEAEDGSHVITYLNAQTGNEEQLLLLLEDEHGTLAL